MTPSRTASRDFEQLELALPSTALSERRASVWLLSASKEDASAFRRSLDAKDGKRIHPFLPVDLETGASPFSPDDLLLLKTSDRADLDLFIPEGLRKTIGLSWIVERLTASFRDPVSGSGALSTLDLALVRFVGHGKRARRRGWTRSRFEKVLDTLMCREIVRDPAWSPLICSELLEDPDLDPESLLRAMALRISADAVASCADWVEGDSAAARAYWHAEDAFARLGALRQASISGRLGDRLVRGPGGQQLEFWQRNVRSNNNGAFGFHIRRFSGMRLPLALPRWSNAPLRDGMLQHEFGQMLELETHRIARWLGGAQASSEMAGLVRDARASNNNRMLEFVVDSELAIRSGLAGHAPDGSARAVYSIMPQSATGVFSPMAAETTFGKPARFEYAARDTRFHRVDLLVLTQGRAPMNIRFAL